MRTFLNFFVIPFHRSRLERRVLLSHRRCYQVHACRIEMASGCGDGPSRRMSLFHFVKNRVPCSSCNKFLFDVELGEAAEEPLMTGFPPSFKRCSFNGEARCCCLRSYRRPPSGGFSVIIISGLRRIKVLRDAILCPCCHVWTFYRCG
jgi:hypothetical protein